jgi:Rrf2 family protein
MITQTAKYALKALAYLAQQDHDRYLMGRDMAEALNIPPNYLGKILQKLSRARLVDSQKGLHGGFKAARPASQISIHDVLLALDAIPSDVAMSPSDTPDEHLPCTFFDRFESIARLYTDFLKQTTLADMLRPPGTAAPDDEPEESDEAASLRRPVLVASVAAAGDADAAN